jgi:hypothetical protein
MDLQVVGSPLFGVFYLTELVMKENPPAVTVHVFF